MPKSSNTISSEKAGGSPAFHPFDPIIDDNSNILILGSFPSIKSFENNFYYAHPRNQFWPLLSSIFNMPAETVEEKRLLLKRNRLALWDVVQSCERSNSADTGLQHCKPNDIPSLLKTHPHIRVIMFTGKKAYELFRRYFPDITLPQIVLPSPSPAYASKRFDEKLDIWRDCFSDFI
ncbi:DNA-deoxyinosine glycosylase [Hydrogenimonas sp.]|uniref:DNA-deoxyinosine glycosylase n=1 Tax=Hydrogenimonas sp. TaxID=2231112 RepID=UPI0026049F79|nr:DNA-deoxyinosine glycosylase [Hydrogenimonas sp.]